jgi:hypothetical protein
MAGSDSSCSIVSIFFPPVAFGLKAMPVKPLCQGRE